MSTPKIHNFQECLEIADEAEGRKHLMLGNGFSIDLFPNIFNYQTLMERVGSERIKSLFKKIGTNDFEYVMRKITDTLKIAEFYPEGKPLLDKLINDLKELKTTLIDVISQSHPANPSAITDEQYQYCYIFLKHFDEGKKYSFNYDLLLYWVYMHFLNDSDQSLKCDDGFRYPEDDQSTVTWEIGREYQQNLYYLHGAMHVFTNENSVIEKYTWINSGKTITDQVRESIDNQKYPIFISEGSKKHKISRINDCSYLGRAFSSLKSIQGSLFIFGHSIRNEDDHVFDYINTKSNIKNIFISIFGDENTKSNQKIFRKVGVWERKFPKKNYYFYNSSSVNVWGHQT